MPKSGDFVKVYFNNGFAREGKVHSWTNKISELICSDGNSFVIQNTDRDVFAIIVYRNTKPEKKQIYRELQEPEKPIRDSGLRAKSLAELHIMRIREERAETQRKLTSFENTGIAQINYERPRTFPKSTPFDS